MAFSMNTIRMVWHQFFIVLQSLFSKVAGLFVRSYWFLHLGCSIYPPSTSWVSHSLVISLFDILYDSTSASRTWLRRRLCWPCGSPWLPSHLRSMLLGKNPVSVCCSYWLTRRSKGWVCKFICVYNETCRNFVIFEIDGLITRSRCQKVSHILQLP